MVLSGFTSIRCHTKEGMADFFRKLFPDIQLPTPATLSCTALNDVYLAVHSQVKDMMTGVKSLCLMFDGWTDKHKARPFMGIRASFVHNWSYRIVTLGCHVLPVHTSREIADHVLNIVGEFVSDVKRILLSTCHDGAANMVKTSQLLKVDNFQHCAAHAMHLLLTVDSINQQTEIVALLQKCRDIVTALHFKAGMLNDELSTTEDKQLVETLRDKMNKATNIMDLDDQYPVEAESLQKVQHQHVSLKASCPTRWNSSLAMLESISDLKREAMNSLKRIGKADLCLDTDELELLDEVKNFLKPFETFTELVGTPTPTLSFIPLIKMNIRKYCAAVIGESKAMKFVKAKVLEKLDVRLPESQAVQIHQLLDPSSKDLMVKEDAISLLMSVVRGLHEKGFLQLQRQQQLSDSDNNSVSPASKRRKMKQEMLIELRRSSVTAPSGGTEEVNAVAVEVAHYLTSMSPLINDDDILGFRSKNCHQYPTLSQVAQLYLAMSSSSVPVESMFSTTGLVCNNKRCMIGEDKLHRVCFIHDNFKLFV